MARYVGLMLIVLALTATKAIAAEVVVLKSTALEYKAGQVFDGSSTIELPIGARIVLMTDSGKPLTLDGPFSGPPAPGNPANNGQLTSALSSLVAKGGVETKKLGTFRVLDLSTDDGASSASNEGLRQVDVLAGGNQCVLSGAKPRLLVKEAALGSVLKVAAGKIKAVGLAVEGGGADWPAEIKVIEGGRYEFAVSPPANGVERSEVKLFIIPGDLPTDAHRVAYMANKNCTHQARMLLSAIAP